MSLSEEIHEQPEVLSRLLSNGEKRVLDIADLLSKRDIDFVYIVARGSSDHAGLYAKYLLGIRNGLPVAMAVPSLFTLYKAPPRLKRALVIGISQSGQSPDLIAAMTHARSQGASTLVITNSADSPLAHAAESVLDIGAGVEEAVAATKSYTAQLMAIAMLSVAMSGERRAFESLRRVPIAVQESLDTWESVRESVGAFKSMTQCIVLGRGFNYATAYEWSLKLKELTYVLAEPYSSADFRHGPIAIVEEGFPVLAAIPRGKVFDEGVGLLEELAKRRAEILVISDAVDSLPMAKTRYKIPSIEEWMSPMISIVPAQLFCHELTLAKGFDPEHPRGLRKVTSTE